MSTAGEVALVKATMAMATAAGTSAVHPLAPTVAAAATPSEQVAAALAAQVSWSFDLAKRHINVLTSPSVLADLAEAFQDIQLRLDSEFSNVGEFAMLASQAAESARRLRNALMIESKMHWKSSDPSFDDTRLAIAFDNMIEAFDELDRRVRMLAPKH